MTAPNPAVQPAAQPLAQAVPNLTLSPAPLPIPDPAPTPTPTAPAQPSPKYRLDLRTIFRTSSAETLETFAEFLPQADRALVIGYLRHTQPTKELAALAGKSEKAIRTRLRTLIVRMNSPTFRLVACNLNKWPKARREAARALFLHGLSLKDASALLKINTVRLKEHRAATLAVLEQIAAQGPPARQGIQQPSVKSLLLTSKETAHAPDANGQ